MNKSFRRFVPCAVVLAWLGAGRPGGWAQEAPSAGESAVAPGVSLSLEEVLKAALERNLDIAVSRVDPKISDTRVESAQAVFDPSISSSAVVGEDNSPQADRLSGQFVTSSKNKTFAAAYLDPLKIGSTFQFEVSTNRHLPGDPGPTYFTQALATYTQPFLRNFGAEVNRTGIVIAQNNQRISKSRFRQTVMDTLASAEKAYWDLNFAILDLKTNEASLQLARDFLAQTQVKVRVGTLPPIEITQAQAGVADREEAVIVAGNAIRTAEDNLRQLINVPSDSPLWDQSILPSDTPQVLEKLVDEKEAVKTAMERRPELEQARLDLASRDADLGFRRNQRLYRLDLVATYGASGLSGAFNIRDPITGLPIGFTSSGVGESFDEVARRGSSIWSAELQLGIPLGNRAADAAYAAAHLNQDQSRLSVQRLEQQVRVEVRDAVRQLETNLKRVRAAQANTKLQHEKLEAEQKKYQNGLSTTFQVLQFQTDLTSAESRENRAVVDYNKSLVDLDRTLGILTDTRNVVIAD